LAVATVAVLGLALGALVVSAPGENPDESIETPDFAFYYPKEWRVLPNPYVRLRATAAGPISQSTVGVSDELVVGVVGPQVLPEAITPANVDQLIAASELNWVRAMTRPGASSTLGPTVTSHAGLPAIESRAIYTQPYGPTEVRVVQVYGGRRMYGITCYTRLSQPQPARRALARGCDQVLDSFEARSPR
jgi:hypothetical protein